MQYKNPDKDKTAVKQSNKTGQSHIAEEKIKLLKGEIKCTHYSHCNWIFSKTFSQYSKIGKNKCKQWKKNKLVLSA